MRLTTETRGYGEIKYPRLKTLGLFILFSQLLLLIARLFLAAINQSVYLENIGIHCWAQLLFMVPAYLAFLVHPQKIAPYVIWFLLLSCFLIRRSTGCIECEDGFWMVAEINFPLGFFLVCLLDLHNVAAHIFVASYAVVQTTAVFLLSSRMIF